MSRGLFVLGLILWSVSMPSAQQTAPANGAAAGTRADVSTMVGTYCTGCHNGSLRSPSGALLDAFDTSRIADGPEAWARAYRQVQAGAMPPAGARRPDRATIDAALAAIEQSMRSAARAMPIATSRAIAIRLAAVVWNSAPDTALLDEAQRDRLRDPAALERQVRRMLADDRAQALVSRFFFPWLQLDQLRNADPDKRFFPDYEISLRDSLTRETELFLLSQLRDDRDPIELWSADYTFLNEQLARHYGVPDVAGPEFRRVNFSTPQRAGLLGQGSILMVTSRHQHGVDAGYTTPATRGKWVRVHFLGVSPPNPFPGARQVKPELPITPQTRTLPAEPCLNCHRNFFPLGYALENFDPIGRWRTQDQGGPVDASGAFVDGTPMNGIVDMRNVLLQYSESFRTTITEKLFVYAATGSVSATSGTPDTLVRTRRVLRNLPNPRWSSLIAAVVREPSGPE